MTALRVLITGGGAGIGKATATAFLEAGQRVHLCDLDDAVLKGALAELPGASGSQVDVTREEDVARLFAEAQGTLDGLDVLVNCVGVSGPAGPIETLSLAEWRACLAANLDSAFLCCRAAAPILKEQGSGLIVNLSSTAGQMGYPNRSPYATAKWGVIGLTKTLAMEMGPFGVRVNALCPGSVEGPRMDRVIAMEAAATARRENDVRLGYTAMTSLRCFVSGADIANMILFLASPAGARISGQALAVDGHTERLVT
ncbi:MAG: SDR family oxidoreductase [Rhodovibrionaceae bacterium]